eukprot:gnl/TRDRNA2_/TRDRNA2_129181_c6_seq1.p1 gnl/TRDRNA2_/TRDRNA2_129181_c6~~gnl/TRDRNA2_/TRDRNA2_129181_c6_seq1.p1  ORF type:complete len:274 (+),score=63.57 gnl/TRDRNA2_/TRDRNA2_129181_c6_seq1:47-823(+)
MLLAVNTHTSAEEARRVTSMLVEFRADPNLPDEDGDTALFWAISKGNLPVAETLLRTGAALTASATECLQSWVHPHDLQRLAEVLVAKLHEEETVASRAASPAATQVRPAWLQVQFGLSGAITAAKKEIVDAEANGRSSAIGEELAVAVLLADFCSGGSAAVENCLSEHLGEPRWSELKHAAAGAILCREVAGAFRGAWQLDQKFVLQMLKAGADPNLGVDVGNDSDEDEDTDGVEEAEEDDDDDDEETSSEEGSSGS